MTAPPRFTPEEIAQRGQEMYDRDLRPRVEPEHTGPFLILDILTGDYEIDDEDLIASGRALAKNPAAILYGVRIGQAAAYRLGACRTADGWDGSGQIGSNGSTPDPRFRGGYRHEN